MINPKPELFEEEEFSDKEIEDLALRHAYNAYIESMSPD